MAGRMKHIVRIIISAGILSLSVAMPVLAVKIGVPQNLRWEETKACWDEVEDAYQYQVVLYKDGVKTKDTINTGTNRVELSGRMREKGKYTFKVRVRERISDKYGSYSSSSEAYTQEETVGTKRKTAKTAAETKEKNPGPGVTGKSWREDGQGWWYDNGDGSYLCGGWYQIDQKWYYFDDGGYLLTGWITVEGRTYYCNSDGSRASGWNKIDEGYYYFDENGVYNPGVKKE